MSAQTAEEARRMIRQGVWRQPTASLTPGFVQTNLIVLPEAFASDFSAFCRANPRALPILDVTAPGSPIPGNVAPEADLRTDLPRYRIYRNGDLIDETGDARDFWPSDAVAFLTGCSFTFDSLLLAEGVPVRHVELGRNVPMYVTTKRTRPVGVFSGPLVVSMRPIRSENLAHVINLTRRLPDVHGEPVHIGNPAELGITDLDSPDAGDPVPVGKGDIPCFWACGVTSQVASEGKPIPWMISHAPGHMFITDLRLADMLARFAESTQASSAG